MSDTADRRFHVQDREAARHHARIVLEPSFEAAAVAWLEQEHVDDATEISVVVRDLETGHEHCFRVNIGAGGVEPCA